MFKFHIFNPVTKVLLSFFICLHYTCWISQYFASFFSNLFDIFSLLFNQIINLLGFRKQLISFLHSVFGCSFSYQSLLRTPWFFGCWASVIFWFDWILRRTSHQIFIKVVFLHRTYVVEWCLLLTYLLKFYQRFAFLAVITFYFIVNEDLIIFSQFFRAWTSIFFKGFAESCHWIFGKTIILMSTVWQLVARALCFLFGKRLSLIISILQKVCAISPLPYFGQ